MCTEHVEVRRTTQGAYAWHGRSFMVRVVYTNEPVLLSLIL